MSDLTRGLRIARAVKALAALAALALIVSGCGSSPPKAFAYVYGTGVGPLVQPPGWEFGYLIGDMGNISQQPLTIESVSLAGPGVGRVVGLAHVQIAPLTGGHQAAPGGQYQTQPPVILTDGCHKQELRPVHGYRIQPGAHARLWIVVKALRPGRWKIPRQVVTYTQGGSTYQHVFPIEYWGSVRIGARVRPRADADQAQCVKPTGASYLPHFHH
jgi:hypothetical protein